VVEKLDTIWMNGQLVRWDDAQVHVLTHTLHYGLGVFEGIRCYRRTDGRSAVFRLQEHVQRLFDSAHVADMPMRWTPHEVEEACLQTIRSNKLDECYIRPLAYLGAGGMGLFPTQNQVDLCIAVWRWGTYLGDDGIKNGIRAKISSFTRPGVNTVMTKSKIVGNYVNSIMAKREVVGAGFDEAILLDPQGYVAEASGENVFLVRGGALVTPPLGASILGGITRNTVMSFCNDLGIEVVERMVARDELYTADEVFLTGTAAEVTPVREIDARKIGEGSRGPITKKLQDRFFQLVRGPEEPHPEWLSFV
jgi:branched-chain amino acid aminotransferase